MRPHPRLPLLLVAALVAAACSGDPTPSASPEATTTAPSPTTAPSSPSPSPSATTSSPSPSPTPSETVPDPEETPDTAEALAERLAAAEVAIRDPETEDLGTWARVQHRAYRTLAYNLEWRDQVLAALPVEVRPAAQANLAAQAELFDLTEPRTELPDWEIVTPPPPEELRGHYEQAAEEFGIDWTYLAAIHLVETRMGRIRGLSSAGAQGPMQFIPETWAAYGEGDVDDPGDAIRAAARYLADHGAPDDMRSALWAYNHSDRYVNAVSAYASVMQQEPETYDAYWHWQVHYRLESGDVVLEEGWTR